MKTALDSNVLSALWSGEPSASRVRAELRIARAQGSTVISAPVYVELSAHPLVSPGFVDKFLTDTRITVEFALDEEVWRTAARAFAAYAQRRRQSGAAEAKRVLPDFLIGAHALMRADRLFTLDPARYRQDFPELRLG